MSQYILGCLSVLYSHVNMDVCYSTRPMLTCFNIFIIRVARYEKLSVWALRAFQALKYQLKFKVAVAPVLRRKFQRSSNYVVLSSLFPQTVRLELLCLEQYVQLWLGFLRSGFRPLHVLVTLHLASSK